VIGVLKHCWLVAGCEVAGWLRSCWLVAKLLVAKLVGCEVVGWLLFLCFVSANIN